MAYSIGDTVNHPGDGRSGVIEEIITNPACLLRQLVIRFEDGQVEEMEELDFGPLD